MQMVRFIKALRAPGWAAVLVSGAVLALTGAARADVVITVDKAKQQMTVVADGTLRWTWPVSTGLARYDTPNGRYTTFRMEKDHFSKEWDDAPMPYSIFFTQQGHAIHGSYHSKLGHPASHGCVRIAPNNAAELFALVKEEGLANTHVVITGELPSSAPLVAERAPVPAARPETTGSIPRTRITTLPPERSQRDEDYAARARAAIARERQREARQTVEPPDVDVPPTLVQPPRTRAHAVESRRRYADRPYAGARDDWRRPGVIYDPYVTVVEEYYVNGRLMRRSYRRPARPGDYAGWR